jgi:hypothetical protein
VTFRRSWAIVEEKIFDRVVVKLMIEAYGRVSLAGEINSWAGEISSWAGEISSWAGEISSRAGERGCLTGESGCRTGEGGARRYEEVAVATCSMFIFASVFSSTYSAIYLEYT